MIMQCITVEPKPGQQLPTFRIPLQFFRRPASFCDTLTLLDVSRDPPSLLRHVASIWQFFPDTDTPSKVQLEAALDSENAPLQSIFLGGGGSDAA